MGESQLNIKELLNLQDSIVEDNYAKVVKVLHKKSVPERCINDFQQYTPLSLACLYGNMKIIRYLSKRSNNIRYEDGLYSPLCAATLGGHIKVVKFLLSKGANINEVATSLQWENTEFIHCSPLLLSIIERHEDISNLLIDNNASIGSSYLVEFDSQRAQDTALSFLLNTRRENLFYKALSKAQPCDLSVYYAGSYRTLPLLEYAVTVGHSWAIPKILERYQELKITPIDALSSGIIKCAFEQNLSQVLRHYLHNTDLDRIESNGKTIKENLEPDMIITLYDYQ